MANLEELTKSIDALPPYLQSLAIEVQNKNDEYEKIKAQLAALKKQSELLEIKAKPIIEAYDEAAQKVAKIKAFIESNPAEAEENEDKLLPVFEENIDLVKVLSMEIKNLKTENEVIVQDITIISEDELKIKNELFELNNTLKINLEFLDQR